MSDLPVQLVAVSAVDHPDRDAWVDEQAAIAATEGGLVLGDYLGRETVLPEPRDPRLCCHLYAAVEDDGGAG